MIDIRMPLREDMRRESANDRQVDGSHYRELSIQPVEFILANELNYLEGNILKYICRHRTKGGAADLDKAMHYLEMLKEYEYES